MSEKDWKLDMGYISCLANIFFLGFALFRTQVYFFLSAMLYEDVINN